MKINELLNAPSQQTALAGPNNADWHIDQAKVDPPASRKRMDIASLGPFAQPQGMLPMASAPAEEPSGGPTGLAHRPRPDLSMSRIIQELETSQPRPTVVHSIRPSIPSASAAAVLKVAPTSSSTRSSASARSKKQSADSSAAAARLRGSRPRGRLGPLTDSEKRVKQRMLVKRSYYRKLDTLNELREQVEALEHEFQHVLHTSSAPPTSPPTSKSTTGVDALRAQYTELAVAQDALRRENEQLRAHAMDQSKMSTRVRILLNEELRDHAETRDALEQVHNTSLPPLPPLSPDVTQSDESEPSAPPSPLSSSASAITFAGLTIRPLSSADCRYNTRAAVADVRSFRDAETRADTTGACVFGWRDRRRVDPDGRTLRFCLEKTFRNLSARELAGRMWGLVSTACGLSRVYASARTTRFELLQRVDDTNVLFYREMRTAAADERNSNSSSSSSSSSVVKSFVLVSLVDLVNEGEGAANGDRFLVLVRSVNPWDRIVSRTSAVEDETWTDVFSWGVYESAGPHGEHCCNAFGGFVRTSPVPFSPGRPPVVRTAGRIRADTAFWLLLVLVIAVRCESEVVGSPFLLSNE